MERRTFLKLTGAAALSGALAGPALAAPATVRWWYHFDNPQASPADLIAKFEAANPDIKIVAENIPWGGGNDYYTRVFASVIAGNAPDCAMVKLNNQARLLEMQALEPIEKMIAAWDARTDISDSIWSVNKASDGHQYYLPLQFVVIYLYYRVDLFAAAGLKPPTTFEEFLAAAKTLTKDGIFGFGMRGGGGGYDNWGPFVLGGGANFSKGGMISDAALKANRFYVGFGTQDKVIPPSAPTDGFKQITTNFQAGRTAMTIHHVGSSNDMVKALGDKVSAVPVPHGPDGKGWTLYGDEFECRVLGFQGEGSRLQMDHLPVDGREQRCLHQADRAAFGDRLRRQARRQPPGPFCRGKYRVPADGRGSARLPQDRRFHGYSLADQYAAGAARSDHARCNDAGNRDPLQRLTHAPHSEPAALAGSLTFPRGCR